MRKIIGQLSANVRTLFLVDGTGAFLTAFTLFAILRTFSGYIGMPASVLTWLSVVAFVFCLYSLTCYFFVRNRWRPFLMVISLANLLYCVLTLGLVIYYRDDMTVLGIAYFLAEMAIILVLVYVEFAVIRQGDPG